MMSTIVDSPQAGLAQGLPITAHAQVRFLERYVDADAVKIARQGAQDDRETLLRLTPDFAGELDTYRKEVTDVMARLKARFGEVPFPRYAVKTNRMRVAILEGTCVTTLPERKGSLRSKRSGRGSKRFDD